jgi:hypothetical protein
MSNNLSTEKDHLEDQVRTYFGSTPPTFQYHVSGGLTQLDLMTTNPRHQQEFLFHQSTGANPIQALESLLEYIREHRALEPTYTIQWRAFDASELNTSYFSAPNILGALDKFFHGRDVHSITVFSVTLNPLS